MIPGGSNSGASTVVTDPSTGETTVIAPSEDPTLAEAVEQAKANSRRGLLVCGSEAIALEALKLFS